MDIVKEEIRIKGETLLADAIRIDNKIITVTGNLLKVARIKDEWYGETVDDPAAISRSIQASGLNADIFTFVQRMPDIEPRHPYPNEPVHLAVLSIPSYRKWWDEQISKDVRKKIRKAERAGVVCRRIELDEDVVRGITQIYNECPVRQGKPFWHYGKSFETIRAEASTYLDKSEFIGAYLQDELIGFVKVVYLHGCASTMHVIAKIAHRDKAPTNALLAKTVEICADRKIPHLSYGEWSDGTLGDFKRYSGFRKVNVPRYYVSLSVKGAIAMRANLHKGVRAMVPKGVKERLVAWRRDWHSRKQDGVRGDA